MGACSWGLERSGVAVFCGCLGPVCVGVFSVRSGPMAVACVLGAVGASHILRAAGLLLRIAYSVGGQALLLGARLGPLAGCILRTDEVCCVARVLCADGFLLLWRILVEVRTLLCGAYSVRGLGLVAWRVPCFGFGFSCLYDVDISPLFNFNRIFPPFPECAETSYLRVQCFMR